MSVRKRIHGAIVASLAKISKADGFNYDIGLVTKKYKPLSELSGSKPMLCAIAGADTSEISGSRELYRCSIVFGIIGYGQTNTDVNDEGILSDAAQDLIEDIENKLITDTSITIGAEADAKLLTISGEEPILDYNANQFTVQVNVVVDFYHAQGQT